MGPTGPGGAYWLTVRFFPAVQLERPRPHDNLDFPIQSAAGA